MQSLLYSGRFVVLPKSPVATGKTGGDLRMRQPAGFGRDADPQILTVPGYFRLMREIFVPSMLRLAMSPCWSKMNA